MLRVTAVLTRNTKIIRRDTYRKELLWRLHPEIWSDWHDGLAAYPLRLRRITEYSLMQHSLAESGRATGAVEHVRGEDGRRHGANGD